MGETRKLAAILVADVVGYTDWRVADAHDRIAPTAYPPFTRTESW
jgi:class 3 adenylate cyclase